jgi:hypothetical protein
LSDYWKKKLDELEQETKGTSSQNYWQKKEKELKQEQEQHKRNVANGKKKKEEEEERVTHRVRDPFAESSIKTRVTDDDDDIAPVKKEEEEPKSWFKSSGLFDDGYDRWDISKTILGSAVDLGENIYAGIVGMGEKAVDAFASMAPYALQNPSTYIAAVPNEEIFKRNEKLFEEAKTESAKFIKQDLYDEQAIARAVITDNAKKIGIDGESHSVFAQKSDALAYSGGQLIGTVGLQAAGVPWWVTSATMSYGAEFENALNQGASYEAAGTSATISATAEVLSEKLFGGSGLGETGLIDTSKLTMGIADKMWKRLADYVGDMFFEGAEEVATDIASNLGSALYREENVWDILTNEEALEGYIDSFFGGGALSGFMNSSKFVKSARKGTSYDANFTKNEQAVFDKEVSKRIAEAEKDGKKLTRKQKNAIRTQVEQDIETGDLSTDSIEEVLGGEAYKQYQDFVDSETHLKEKRELTQDTIDGLQNEFDYLNKMKQGEMTGEQIDRRAELKELLATERANLAQITEELESEASRTAREQQRSQLKEQLSRQVAQQVRGDRLFKSYTESDARRQYFQDDLSKHTDPYARKSIENLMQSKTVNNARHSRALAETVAKIAADTKTEFRFVTKAQIKESGQSYHGNKTLTADGNTAVFDIGAKNIDPDVVVKIDGKAVENFEVDTENGTITFDTAPAQGEISVEYEATNWVNGWNDGKGHITVNMESKRYWNYIVGHEITHSTEKTKHYTKMAKAVIEYAKKKGDYQSRLDALTRSYNEGTDVEAELVADLVGDYIFSDYDFAKHLASSNQNIFQRMFSEIKHLLKMTTARSKEARMLERARYNFAKAYMEVGKAKSTSSQQTIDTKATKDATPTAEVETDTSGNEITDDDLEFLDREAMYAELDELYDQWFDLLEQQRKADEKITAAMDKGGRDIAAIDDYERIESEIRETWEKIDAMQEKLVGDIDVGQFEQALEEDIQQEADTEAESKTQHSLTSEQQEYFKDSVVRDENGNLKVMYHGTSKGGHTVFDTYGSNYGLFGQGSYFTDNKDIAQSYTKKGKGKNPQVYETYLNITNPIDMDAQADPAQWQEAFPDAYFPESGTNEEFYRAMEEYFEDNEYSRWEAAEVAMDALMGMGYDGITHIGGGRVNADGERHQVYIAFNPEQIKNVDNAQPTNDPDIRYSLSDDGRAEVVNGIAVATNTAEVMRSGEYAKPKDYMAQYSVSTEPAWRKNHLALNKTEEAKRNADAIRRFTEMMVQDDAVRGYVPMGEYKTDKMGPLRKNVEYIWTFDMDTSCPRTFQFLNFRDAIQRKAGRYLTYNESINMLELMRAYGQQIPCCYCYVENKRVLLSASYNNFFGFRNAVMTAQTEEDAAKAMYGYSEKKGLPDASRKALERWRSDMSYNPSLTEVWTATNTARNSVLNFLDGKLAEGSINAKTPESRLNKMILDEFGIEDKGAVVEIESFVRDWAYDTLANIPHTYNIDNDTSVSVVDERALALNHEALAYSKSASSAKNVDNYIPYTDQLKNVSAEDREYILGMGGIRKHSSNDFRMDYVQDYFMFYADLAAGKWTGHTYTKSTDFAKIFACTGDRINMSIAFYEDADGTLRENIDEGASHRDVKELRKVYKNVGSMAMVTSDNQLSHALNSDWIDMIIPFHASGLDKSVWYNLRMWNDYTSKQGERFYNADTMKQKLKNAGVEIPKGANAAQIKALFEETFQIKHIYGKKGEILKPHFFPGDTYVNGQLVPGHHNNAETYFRLCEEYGVHPRFYGVKVTDTNGNVIDATEHPSYLKLIKETSRTDSEQEVIQFNFGNYDEYLKMTPFEYAMKRLQEEAKNGGFENTKADPYGVVKEFADEYLDKDRPLGYLTDRAKETREMLLEMSRQTAKRQAQVAEEAARSISDPGEEHPFYGNYGAPAADLAVVKDDAGFAPVAENATTAPVGVSERENTTPATVSEEEMVAPPPGDEDAPPLKIETVADRIQQKIINATEELENIRQFRDQAVKEYDDDISKAKAELEGKKNQDSKAAQTLRKRIERLTRLKADINADYDKRISDLEKRIEKLHSKEYSRAEHGKAKNQEHTTFWENLIGDTSTWVDLPTGLSYKTKTLRRILRKVVRDATGNPDFQKADAIYDALETKYDNHEAQLKTESKRLKQGFFDLKLNRYEDKFAQMLGEAMYNPNADLKMTEVEALRDTVYKGKVDIAKVERAIEEARTLYESLYARVNEVLREQGFKELPYIEGYFPHFRNPEQGWLGKLLNWKTIDNEIPTSIAGLTELFEPKRSWQSFAQRRKGKKTDYSLYHGLDTYIHGALDWIYHIDDLQSRRSLENLIRYTHSEKGIQERVDRIKGDETLDADEKQTAIDAVLNEANNPLNGLVVELRSRTNTLANKKHSMDRGMEEDTNRKIYSTMTNLNNRINANHVVGSFSAALSNIIPIPQSWLQVSPYYTLAGARDFVRSTIRDDGIVARSDFLTNRLIEEEKLYKTWWDKASDKVAFMMNAIDSMTSQTVWRSKYLQNLREGMSESAAIKDADQFAKNLMAGRSRGNAPSIFDAKNPLVKLFTAFQLEVANQYGYMFEDAPQDTKNKARLVKGYAASFMGAYLYNALYSTLTGRDAAFDPIGIMEDLLDGLFGDDDDEEEELADVLMDFGTDVAQQVPFIGGLLGGGRVPMSAAFPYSGDSTPLKSFASDWEKGWNEGKPLEGDWKALANEMLKPLWYLALPFGGGQLKKTTQGLGMFDEDLPIAGSYTDSGKLRFPVEDTPLNRAQAALFGQYASENARTYFDDEIAPLGDKQIQEFDALDIPIRDYWEYQETAKDLSKQAEEDNASDETVLMSKYLNSVNDELSDLLKEEKDVSEDTTLSDAMRQYKLSQIQTQFDNLARERYESYGKVSINGEYANVGSLYFKRNDDGEWQKLSDDQVRKYLITSAAGDASYATDGTLHYRREADGSWTKISDRQLERQKEVTEALGITPEEYWSKTDISFLPMSDGEYEYGFDNPGKYAVSKAVFNEFSEYERVQDEINTIKENNDSDSGTADKELVTQYIFGLDIDYGQQAILYRSLYGSKADKNKYNLDIVEYLNSRSDISYEDTVAILEELGMTVDEEGNVYW